jgi:Zn-finger protein
LFGFYIGYGRRIMMISYVESTDGVRCSFCFCPYVCTEVVRTK